VLRQGAVLLISICGVDRGVRARVKFVGIIDFGQSNA
jgi:hypothetical protein